MAPYFNFRFCVRPRPGRTQARWLLIGIWGLIPTLVDSSSYLGARLSPPRIPSWQMSRFRSRLGFPDPKNDEVTRHPGLGSGTTQIISHLFFFKKKIDSKRTTYIPLIVLAFWRVICYRSHLLGEPEKNH